MEDKHIITYHFNFYSAHSTPYLFNSATEGLTVHLSTGKDLPYQAVLNASNARKTRGEDLILFKDYDGYKNTGCYNIQCPGFVQIDRSFAFGGDVKPVSIYCLKFNLLLKRWLVLVDKILGYWPGALFTGLADHSTAIIMGGAFLNKKVDGHQWLLQ
ncbi:hypothetical protein ACOSQ3_020542 [Xanthoceras sorbifolium]